MNDGAAQTGLNGWPASRARGEGPGKEWANLDSCAAAQ